MTALSAPPLSLYVHLPWCVRKCPYCDFNSHALKGDLPEDAYVEALLLDLEEELALVPGRRIETVFFGGGTPSLFSAAALARLIDRLRAVGALAPTAEVTLEANPGAVEHGRFAQLRAAGINRVSLGVQSFDASQLARLGRIHSAGESLKAIDELDRAGIDNFNIDLMYGLPEQTLDQARRDLERALATGPAHISHYQLTLEPNTLFWHRPPPLPEDDQIGQMLADSQALLAAAGYEQYEVSAYAAPGRRSAHNVNYWTYGDYLGVGAGAHGKLTREGQISRRTKRRHPADYMKPDGSRLQESRAVPGPERVFEFMLNALRLRDGFDRQLFEARTGLSFEAARAGMDAALEKGLLEPRANGWRASALGWRFLNDLQALFLPETEHD